MKEELIISIVTPSFNQGEFIGETIRSVIHQEGNFYIDYMIMDGGSTDDTVGIIQGYDEKIKALPRKVHMKGLDFFSSATGDDSFGCKGISLRWVSDRDRGQADALNKGFRIAAGAILAFLNSDDTYYPGSLQKIASAKWKHTDLIYGHGMWVSREGRELLPYPTFRPDKYSFFYQCTLCQPSVFINRKAFEKLGEFSTEFNVIFDFEYWMRAVFRGMKFRYLDSMLATSRFYVENKTVSLKETQVNELPKLRKMYYTGPFGLYGKWKVKQAKETVHKPTVETVNRLHQMINSDIRYVFK
jgi:glycosyltransferase involved in cell wall biosynthesis